jgi:hypothetical protein
VGDEDGVELHFAFLNHETVNPQRVIHPALAPGTVGIR